ncbi:aminopeptidase P family protein [Clostridium bornimense]|uniref:aminopeptidase P family protein n=1 Tax=Clostridium bornimense TaxID=1216932 RepID=UPI001C117B9B|nr:aminopeptidase P family protein [Clostridium bornimense]MBU5316535.1 aminopeptidase P family protein [Clostridium bornimense]
MINKNVEALRSLMNERGIDAYIIPTADFHESEYVGEYFEARKFISGFTGSAGIVVITKDVAGLWTDGRYFIQAANEIKGTCFKLFPMGEEGVPTIKEFLKDAVKENGCIGFDGRVMNTRYVEDIENTLEGKNVTIKYQEDLVDLIWGNRPEISKKPAFLLPVKYAGKEAVDKLKDLRNVMEEKNADVHILTSLDDIAWLFNIRGNDVQCNPVVLSYAIVKKDTATLYVDKTVLNDEIVKYLTAADVTIKDYNDIYEDVKKISADATVLLDTNKVNYTLTKTLPEGIKIISEMNPTTFAKAIKNSVEIENLRKAHIKDGVAFTKFMYWLKNNIGKTKITEISASDYLENCRRAQDGFIELSFPTIAGYKANAAMMHYSATEDTAAELKEEGLLLVDSGGQYFEGTTDITRTMALGPISDKLKLHFTTVTRSMLNLANAKFLYGCRGMNLDILARGPLWELGIDYKCGTGHGVGYLLNVHEAPNGFRWRIVPERNDSCVFEEGMVTTDEPGVYIEGSHGIRIENELVCRKAEKNEYGQFMDFETITYAPIDLDAIDPSLMSKKEIEMLNKYHAMVYEKISPYMTEEENLWLKKYTRSI